MILVRPLTTNLKIAVRDDYTVSACSAPIPDSVYKCFHPLLVSGRESDFGQMSATLPPLLSASEVKQMFLSKNLACLLAFEQQVAGPLTLSIIQQVRAQSLGTRSHTLQLRVHLLQLKILRAALKIKDPATKT